MSEPTSDLSQEIVSVTEEYYQQSETAMKPVRKTWDVAWALFNQQYDFSQKEKWQHKVAIPKISGAVRTAVALFKQALIRSQDWFAVKTPVKGLQQYIPLATGTLKYWLERIDFVNVFAEGVHGGLLSSLVIFKIFWKKGKKTESQDSRSSQIRPSEPSGIVDQDNVKTQFEESGFLGEVLTVKSEEDYESDGELVIYAVDPYKFKIDPTGRNKFVIEEITVDYDEFIESAREKGYDMAEISKIQSDMAPKTTEEIEEARRKGQAEVLGKPTFRREVRIRECWGDLLNKEGKKIHTNVTWSVANEKYLIRKPTKNPFWHGKFPYVWGPIIRKPFSIWHKGFTEDIQGIQMAITELFGAILDSNLIASLRAFELDVDMVADPEQFKNGIWPGKTYKKHGAIAGQGRMIQDLEVGTFVPQSIRVYQELDRIFQNESVITEFVSGGQGARGRATATEVISKTNQATTLIQDIAVDIENFVLSPVLEMIFCLIMQYQRNFQDERFNSFIQEELLNRVILLDDEERKNFMDDQFFFKVSGVSGYINRISQVQKFQVLTQVFQYAPELIQWFKKDKLLKNVLEWLNWDPEDMLNSPEEMKALQMQQAPPPQAAPPQGPQGPSGPGMPAEIQQLMMQMGQGG